MLSYGIHDSIFEGSYIRTDSSWYLLLGKNISLLDGTVKSPMFLKGFSFSDLVVPVIYQEDSISMNILEPKGTYIDISYKFLENWGMISYILDVGGKANYHEFYTLNSVNGKSFNITNLRDIITNTSTVMTQGTTKNVNSQNNHTIKMLNGILIKKKIVDVMGRNVEIQKVQKFKNLFIGIEN